MKVAEQAKKFGRGASRGASHNCGAKAVHRASVTNSEQQAKFSVRTRNLALMLIPVNVLFLAFLAPVVLTMYIYDKLSADQLTLAVVEMLSYCNFTLNFFIYFLTSSKFREEFFKCVAETCALSVKCFGIRHDSARIDNGTSPAKRDSKKKARFVTEEATIGVTCAAVDDVCVPMISAAQQVEHMGNDKSS